MKAIVLKTNSELDKDVNYRKENLFVLSIEERLELLYKIIKTLSDKNITLLLYSARGLTKNGD